MIWTLRGARRSAKEDRIPCNEVMYMRVHQMHKIVPKADMECLHCSANKLSSSGGCQKFGDLVSAVASEKEVGDMALHSRGDMNLEQWCAVHSVHRYIHRYKATAGWRIGQYITSFFPVVELRNERVDERISLVNEWLCNDPRLNGLPKTEWGLHWIDYWATTWCWVDCITMTLSCTFR